MLLKQWRENKRLTQAQLAEQLTEFTGKTLSQASIYYWERGTMPGKFWRKALERFTKEKVKPNDLGRPSPDALSEEIHEHL